MEYTLTFDENNKGWTSFHSFIPDWMFRVNNRFYTVKDGQIYLHNDESVNRNYFYGIQYNSKLELMVNAFPSDVKVFQNIEIEGNKPWDMVVKAFQSDREEFYKTSIDNTDFVEKEGVWYAVIKRNDQGIDLKAKSSYGLGEVVSIIGNAINIEGFNSSLTEGDTIINDSLQTVGNLLSHTTNGQQSTLVMSSVSNISSGDFLIGVKNSKIESSPMRGYTLKLELENDSTERVELFSIDTHLEKSYR